ncbi:hypothetical protein NDU88_010249 [Pleurodeles waltl]|uniref:Uncharacterized protein n=1 Tax=Pleurodeles waltl TaxID=8319 RepID=A0AAV7PXH5_PLEWA|nr:hypothetical protein NDU88_010249 [Pleurodeles waltl]
MLRTDLCKVAEMSVEMESQVIEMREDVSWRKAKVAGLEARLSKTEGRLDDAEGRSHRCNLRLVGNPEGTKEAALPNVNLKFFAVERLEQELGEVEERLAELQRQAPGQQLGDALLVEAHRKVAAVWDRLDYHV